MTPSGTQRREKRPIYSRVCIYVEYDKELTRAISHNLELLIIYFDVASFGNLF